MPAEAPRHSLAASVVVADDIPVLRVAEACAAPVYGPHGVQTRGYRLDTVEEDEAASTSLRLPNAQGTPPDHGA